MAVVNATMTGAGYNASGKFGSSLNAGSGVFALTNVPANAAAQTFELWVKRNGNPSSTAVAMGSLNYMYMGASTTGFPTAHYGASGTQVAIDGTTTICDNAWHHLRLNLDPTTGGTFYVDGVLVGSSATTLVAANGSRANGIGMAIYAGGANPWGGETDEYAVWSAIQNTAPFTPPTSAYTGSESNLAGLYHVDGNGLDSAGAVAATAITMSGPTTGTVGVASSNFTFAANGTITGTIVVTPSDGGAGGTFSPTTVSISSGTPSAAATYTAASVGAKTISCTNNGGLTNPSNITFTASAASSGFDQTKVVFSPFNWNVGTGTAKAINPGAYFRTIFGGTSCTLQFDMTGILTPLPQIMYRIDDYGPWTLADIAASVVLTMPTDTAGWANNGGHLLEVRIKATTESQLRWATQATAVVISTIALDATKTLSLPPKAAQTMLFYGDSIAEGCRTVKAAGTPDVNSHDAALGWAPALARALGFEYGIVGFSAQGCLQGGVGGVPSFPNTYNFIYSGVARSFSPAPDVIVINQGTNDTGDITATMTTVLNGLLAATPKTTRIVVLRPFKDATHTTQLQAAIAACTAPTRCKFIDTAGFFITSKSSDGLHPYGNANIGDIAPAIVTAIRSFVAPIPGTRTARTVNLALFQDAAGTVPAADATGLVWSFFDQLSPDSLTVPADTGAAAVILAGTLNMTVYSTKAAGQQGYLVLSTADGTKAFRGAVTLS